MKPLQWQIIYRKEIFRRKLYNALPADEQLDILKKYLPIGIKVYTHMNMDQFLSLEHLSVIESTVFDYTLMSNGVWGVRTDLDEVEYDNGFLYGRKINLGEKIHDWIFPNARIFENKAVHPDWLYPIEPLRIFTLNKLLDDDKN